MRHIPSGKAATCRCIGCAISGVGVYRRQMVKKRPDCLTTEEMKQISEIARADDFLFMFVMTMRFTGRRLGELYGVFNHTTKAWEKGMIVADVDFNKSFFLVHIIKKGSWIRQEAPLTPEVRDIIKAYVERHRLSPHDFLFRKLSYRQIQRRVTDLVRLAGIHKVFGVHGFRHYFITKLLLDGWSEKKICVLLGLSRLPSTYSHLITRDLRDEALEAYKSL